MTELFTQSPLPAFLLFIGAALATLCRQNTLRNVLFILAPVVTFAYVHSLEIGQSISFSFLPGFDEVEPLRVTKLSKAFGYIFTLNAAIVFLFGWVVKKPTQNIWALLYIGSGLGVVFAGDLITLYVFWELMAVTSTFVILARQTNKARGAAFRYILIHVLGGLFLLAGIVMTVAKTGSLAFDGFDYTNADLGTWLMLVGILVNAAAPPFSAWLSDAYPEASVTGGLILSAYTTKTAVYVLLQGFAGWTPLITIGCIMAVYGIIYALLENDMRRILAYSIINQVGFMVCAAGIGTELAISGATAHAFCHIIYKSLLWMSAGAVLYRVGKSKCTELGGLYKTMPWTLVFGTIGAIAISAVPLTSGFTSKTIILLAAEEEHLLWPWLILEMASAGVFLHAGIKFPYFVFFNQDRGLRPKEAPSTMLIGMGIMSFLCIYLGCHPQPLYDILPYSVGDYNAYKAAKLVTQMQLLLLSAAVFFVFLKLLKRTPTIALDSDWFYRKGTPYLVNGLDKSLNSFNALAHKTIVGRGISAVGRFTAAGPSKLLILAMNPLWTAQGLNEDEKETLREKFYDRARVGAFPIGMTACLAIVLLAILLVSVR